MIEENSFFTFCVWVENTPGVLLRLATIFTRRKVNIESLTVSSTEREGVSRITIVVSSNAELAQKMAKQIHRGVDVREVFVSEDKDLIHKEIAFIRVGTDANGLLETVVNDHGARILFSKPGSYLVEKSGEVGEIDCLLEQLSPFQVLELTRSGRIAYLKNEHGFW